MGDFSIDRIKGSSNITEGLQKWGDGSFNKVLLHGVVGGGLSYISDHDFATGAAANALNEALSPTLTNLLGESGAGRTAGSQIVGMAGAIATDGNASTGANLGKLADTYNRQAHLNESLVLQKLQDGVSEEEKYRLKAAACYLIRCANSVPDNDPKKQSLTDLQLAGSQLDGEQKVIKDFSKQLESLPSMENLFDYGAEDKVNDFLWYHDEGLRLTGPVYTMGKGAVETGVGAVGAFACPETGISCGLALYGFKSGTSDISNGLSDFKGALSSPYDSKIGIRVEQSLDYENFPDDPNRFRYVLGGIGKEAISILGDKAIDKAGKKADEKIKNWLNDNSSGASVKYSGGNGSYWGDGEF